MEGKKGKYLVRLFFLSVFFMRIIPDNFAAYKKDHPGFPQTL